MKRLQKTPEKNKQTVTEKKADKRIRIMRAAIDLFREKGYEATRIIDIAKKAGIGKGTVYAYFDGKESLVLEIVRDIVLEDYREFYRESREGGGTKERLIAHLTGAEKMISRYGLYARIFFEQFAGSQSVDSGPVMEVVRSMTDDQFARVRSIIVEGSEARKKGGGSPLTEEEIEDGTKLALMIISSYMMSLINAGETERGGGLAEIPVVEKDKIADFIINGIGLKDLTIKEAEND